MKCLMDKKEMLPGVWMLTDRMGMHMTLLVGSEKALLVDTGYGFDDLMAMIRQITPLPVTVLLTHGHHDHACGACQFENVLLHEAEQPVFELYAAAWRKRVWQQAMDKKLDLSDWTEETYTSLPCGNGVHTEEMEIALGGLTAQVLHCPGHTKGSLCVYVKERKLLLPGDDMNPTTWIFFPECEGLCTLIASLERLSALDFEQVLCPHHPELLPREDFDRFVQGLTRENIAATAEKAFHLWEGKRVYAYHPRKEFTLCFDADKLPADWQEFCRNM